MVLTEDTCKVIRRISEAFAEISLAMRDDWLKEDDPHNSPLIPESESLRGKRVLISTDGGRILIRKNKRGRIAKGKTRHGFTAKWREPKLITIRAIHPSSVKDRISQIVYNIGRNRHFLMFLKSNVISAFC